MKFLITDTVHKILMKKLNDQGFETDYLPNASAEEIIRILPNYDGLILRSKIKITEKVLQKTQKLKIIARVGSGLENIDIQAAQKLGITVINSPEGNRTAVAEHALGLILNLFAKINKANNEIKQNIWQREANRGIELEGKIVGIIGYGNTGSAFAKRLSGFDTITLAYDKYKKNFSTTYVQEVDLKEIMENADIISLHIPLTNDTLHLINKNFIEKMKKPFFLINTSRGKIVNTADLVQGLKSGKILGACLDVLEYEKFNFDLDKKENKNFTFLKNNPNVILTPHIAGLTEESFRKLSEITAEKIIKIFSNNHP